MALFLYIQSNDVLMELENEIASFPAKDKLTINVNRIFRPRELGNCLM